MTARRVKVGGNLYRPAVPAGAVYVGRQAPGLARSPFANPHPGGKPCRLCRGAVHDRDDALKLYAAHLAARPDLIAAARRDLAGRTLACWCPLDQPCHVDILDAIANQTAGVSP